MSKTTYAGLDYSGPGSKVNRDADNGIRYGVISEHSVSEAWGDVYQDCKDLTHEEFIAEFKLKIRGVLSDYLSDYASEGRKSSLDIGVEEVLNAIEDAINDRYDPQEVSLSYEKEGYVIQTCLQSDLMVIKSPFYTYAQFCSPCVPGACNLDSPLEFLRDASDKPLSAPTSNKCYCLGHDWFEGGRAPYPVFKVDTNEEVQPNSATE